jgi:prepilin-type N-terminal cleavage/methylation domain-containing protein/prepilin-type processing-associated H-X9-DG protein
MPREATGRAGFTLIEVLVVITIIAVLLSLMLPALSASREAARRVNCVNNLRQVVLALQNYEFHCGALPPGSVDHWGPIRNQPEGLQIGWICQLLPYIEQTAVHQTIDTKVSVYDPLNGTAAATQFKTFGCPSDPQAGSVGGFGVSSYAGCHHDAEAPIDVDNSGVLFLNSSVRRGDVSDGTSYTVFVGEKSIDPNDLGWMSGTRATLRNTGAPINAGPPAGDDVGGFSSKHPGGANFAFGDGSVRFLSERIDAHVYRLLGSRADGEPISDDSF